MATEAFAPAKINLTLHVTGQRADGYHLLDSLVPLRMWGISWNLRRARPVDLRLPVSLPQACPDR